MINQLKVPLTDGKESKTKARLLANALLELVLSRRREWTEFLNWNCNKLVTYCKELLQKVQETVKPGYTTEDDIKILLGYRCHVKSAKAYFPQHSTHSGDPYNFDAWEKEQKSKKDKDKQDKEDKDKAAPTDKRSKSKPKSTDEFIPYPCNDDCITLTDDGKEAVRQLITYLSAIVSKDIRENVQYLIECSNLNLDKPYQLIVSKRNHPEACYIQQTRCPSGEVFIRHTAPHSTTFRKILKLFVFMKQSHLFIADLDAACALKDLEYLVKLVSIKVPKSPVISLVADDPVRRWTAEAIKETYAEHIEEFRRDVADLPRHGCRSCDKYVKAHQILTIKNSWVHSNNPLYNLLKEEIGVKNWDKEKTTICKTCAQHLNANQMPHNSVLNNMAPGVCPPEITTLSPFELNFIRRVKAFQFIVKCQTVGSHIPYRNRVAKLKGSVFYLPMPIESALNQLNQDKIDYKSNNSFILVHGIPKADKSMWKFLIDVEKVHAALTWLKANNHLYYTIQLPEDPKDLLATDDEFENQTYESDPLLNDHDITQDIGGAPDAESDFQLSDSLEEYIINPTTVESNDSQFSELNDSLEDYDMINPIPPEVNHSQFSQLNKFEFNSSPATADVSSSSLINSSPAAAANRAPSRKRNLSGGAGNLERKKTLDLASSIICDLTICKPCKKKVVSVYKVITQPNRSHYINKVDRKVFKYLKGKSNVDIFHDLQTYKNVKSNRLVPLSTCVKAAWLVPSKTCRKCASHTLIVNSGAHIQKSRPHCVQNIATKNLANFKELNDLATNAQCSRCFSEIKRLSKALQIEDLGGLMKLSPANLTTKWLSNFAVACYLQESKIMRERHGLIRCLQGSPTEPLACSSFPIVAKMNYSHLSQYLFKAPAVKTLADCPKSANVDSYLTSPNYDKDEEMFTLFETLALSGGQGPCNEGEDDGQSMDTDNCDAIPDSILDTDGEFDELSSDDLMDFRPPYTDNNNNYRYDGDAEDVDDVDVDVENEDVAEDEVTDDHPGNHDTGDRRNTSPTASNKQENADAQARNGETKNDDAEDGINDEQVDPKTWLERLTRHEAKNLLDHHVILGNVDENKNRLCDDLYKEVRIESSFLDTRLKDLDVLSNPDVYPRGRCGRNDDRPFAVQPHQFERTRLVSTNGTARRNMSYLFQLAQDGERRHIRDGVYELLNRVNTFKDLSAGQLLGMLNTEKTPDLERNLTKVLKKVKNTAPYWAGPLSKLNAKAQQLGPPSTFLTLSPAEYDDEELYLFLKEVNQDLPGVDDLTPSELSAKDPLMTSLYIHNRFQALLKFITNARPLGEILDIWYRIEYQSRCTAHLHILLWQAEVPVIGTSTNQEVLDYINKNISCHLPDKFLDGELYNIVNSYQTHKCQSYCLRRSKSKHGKWKRVKCRFGFPKPVVDRSQLHDVLSSIVGRKTLNAKKSLYDLTRKPNEKFINPYNPIIIYLHKGNMDIQMISENTYSICEYLCKYISKPEKSNTKEFAGDFAKDKDLIGQVYKFAFRALRSREIGAHECADRFFLPELWHSSRDFVFVSTTSPNKRSRMLKPRAQLEKDHDSLDIYQPDMMHVYYPMRPLTHENMNLFDFASQYQRQKIGVERITLQNRRGCMWKRSKEAIVQYFEHDLHTKPDLFYFSMLALFMPWRNEADLLLGQKSHSAAFEVASQLDETLVLKVERIKHIKLIRKQMREKEKKEVVDNANGSDSSGCDDDDLTKIEQLAEDFDAVNRAVEVETREQLDDLINSLNVDQRRCFNKITHAIQHNLKICDCEHIPDKLHFITGVGGSGKSYLLKAVKAWSFINSLEGKFVNTIGICGPTGLAAMNICGLTFHQLFCIPVEHGSHPKFRPLSQTNLHQMRVLMKDMHCVIIDEGSMLNNLNVLYCSLRLDEVFNAGEWFGGKVIIIFGDLCQLPPVNANPPYTDIPADTVNKFTNGLAMPTNLWQMFSFDQLKINQRQAGSTNTVWRELLARVRVGCLTNNDVKILAGRLIPCSMESTISTRLNTIVEYYIQLVIKGNNPVCLLPTKLMVDDFNEAATVRLGIETVEIAAEDTMSCRYSAAEKNAWAKLKSIDTDSRNTGGLSASLRVGVGSKIMLRRNLDLSRKLVNGSMGEITGFIIEDGKVVKINILFDGSTEITALERSESKVMLFQQAFVYRRQFPITTSYGMTIHKSQGLSLDCVMTDIGESIFGGGMTYVALSRCTTLAGLHLINFDPKRIYPPTGALAEYIRLTESADKDYKIPKPTNLKSSSIQERVWYKTKLKKQVNNQFIEELDNSLPKKPKRSRTKNKNKLPKITKKDNKAPKMPTRENVPPTIINTVARIGTERRPALHDANLDYHRVDTVWQRERAAALGLVVVHEIPNDPPLLGLTTGQEPDRNKSVECGGAGNCLFRSLSWFLTGIPDSHVLIRQMTVNFVNENFETFRRLITTDPMNIRTSTIELQEWIAMKSETSSRGRHHRSHWGDHNCIIAASLLLRTPIYSFAPVLGNRLMAPFWNTLNANVMTIAENYPANATYTVSDMQITLDNRSDHFVPTGLTRI